MKRFKRYVMTTATGLLLCAAQAGAELRVIADLGGSDAGRFYEAINRQADSGTSSPVTALLPQESAMLPVSTPEMSPGEVTPRSLQLPGLGALFLVGMMHSPVSGCRRMRPRCLKGRLPVWW